MCRNDIWHWYAVKVQSEAEEDEEEGVQTVQQPMLALPAPPTTTQPRQRQAEEAAPAVLDSLSLETSTTQVHSTIKLLLMRRSTACSAAQPLSETPEHSNLASIAQAVAHSTHMLHLTQSCKA